jgi:predicted nucleic acid-binding protein
VPRIVDTVTFRHFAAIDRLGVLESRLLQHDPPRCGWAVWQELFDAATGEEDCQRVLEAGILGNPHVVNMPGLKKVFETRRAMSIDETESNHHLGEAESIVIADLLNGAFVTDDSDAFAFAERILGNNRVFDTVDLLRECVGANYLSSHDAKNMADAIRNCGRSLRREHPSTLTPDYFDAPISDWG